MAKYASDSVAFLLIDGYSVLGQTTNIDAAVEAVLEDTTPLGVSYQEQTYTGIKRATISQQGFFDDAANSSHDALKASPGVARMLTFGLEGNTIGKGFTGFSGAMQVNYTRQSTVGQVHRSNASYQSHGHVEEGVILHELSTETAAGNTEADGYDGTASSADGGAAYLQVTALTLGGYDNLDVAILDSADDITYAEVAAFTVVTAAPEAERVAVAGTVERYLASSWVFTGTGASPSATFFAGFSRA